MRSLTALSYESLCLYMLTLVYLTDTSGGDDAKGVLKAARDGYSREELGKKDYELRIKMSDNPGSGEGSQEDTYILKMVRPYSFCHMLRSTSTFIRSAVIQSQICDSSLSRSNLNFQNFILIKKQVKLYTCLVVL